MEELNIDPASTALVVIDLQKGIAGGNTVPHAAADVISRTARVVKACRARGVTVILVHVDVGKNGALFPRVIADQPRPPMNPPADWAEIVPEIEPNLADAIVTKHQPNAFYATDLEVHLSRRNITTIMLCGIATNLGVESTARAAHERGFQQIFMEDAMAARELDLHVHAVKRILPTMGRVRSVEQVLAALG
jgi:nicotinamidase-related amidase